MLLKFTISLFPYNCHYLYPQSVHTENEAESIKDKFMN